jgi:hypothetical protein
VPPFTCSIGLVDSVENADFFPMLRAADQALLNAKTAGRDRIVIGDDSITPVEVTLDPVTVEQSR